jgi:ketosteroid isomerase-like protein
MQRNTSFPSAREVVQRYLDASTDPSGLGIADLYADRLVIETPFAPPPLPKTTEITREELRERLAAGKATRVYDAVDSVSIHETADPEKIILEYDLHGRALPADTPFTLSYIMVITVRNGLIVHKRDYADPIAGMAAFGLLPRLVDTLTTS